MSKEVFQSEMFEKPVQKPPFRRLRGYSFDPSLSTQLDTVVINEVIFKVRWEDEINENETDNDPDNAKIEEDNEASAHLSKKRNQGFGAGPVGEYIEVIDYDPASGLFYPPVDLNDPYILAQDGLMPSESNPHFHQQMVYAVSMTTIQNFERALGRWAMWSSRLLPNPKRKKDPHASRWIEAYTQRLRIYPHALRDANAYYSPAKKALLFGYFPATTDSPNIQLPGGVVFTCLSHDIITHETTHALLDGMFKKYIASPEPDTLAFHEAFADIVALFQHFTFPEVLKHQVAKTRGNLETQNLLGELAQQFGKAIGNYGSLRDAIGGINPKTKKWELKDPDPAAYLKTTEPHDLGAILVSAVFEAFISIYKKRIADLIRIATEGKGILPEGELHPDLINRLASEASKAAQHVLNICIRALDYCPPVDINFGDYFRAIITADADLVPDDDMEYRVAFIEAFRRRGIFPTDIKTLSPESLRWPKAKPGVLKNHFKWIANELTGLFGSNDFFKDRYTAFTETQRIKAKLHQLLEKKFENSEEFQEITGLSFSRNDVAKYHFRKGRFGQPVFEVHTLNKARRTSPDGGSLNQIIISIIQKRNVPLTNNRSSGRNDTAASFKYRGGCTLILNMDTLELKYAIVKNVMDQKRLEKYRERIESSNGTSLRATYFNSVENADEPFARLHHSF